MLCKEIMQWPVRWVSEQDTVETAARIMKRENIGFLPVTDASGRFIGTLTDRDIVVRAVAEELPAGTRVAQVMTHEAVRCSREDDLGHARHLMGLHAKSRIVCTDAGGHIEGVISVGDLAVKDQGAGHTLKQIAAREVRAAPSGGAVFGIGSRGACGRP
jgi:CBS domain-containing protein